MQQLLSRMVVFLSLTLLISSCGHIEEITIGEIQEARIKGFKDNAVIVDVKIPVENPTIHRIKLVDMDINTYIGNKYIGKLQLDKELIIKGTESAVYDLPVRIRISNILNIAFVMMNMKSGRQVDLHFKGTATAKSLLIKKTVEIDEKRRVAF